MNYQAILAKQKSFFYSGGTQTYKQRMLQLQRLKSEIENREQAILDALQADFKKPAFEGYMTELAMVYLELKIHIKHLKKWMQTEKVRASLLNFPSSEYIQKQPYGSVLIIAPWNYPFLLCFQPLISAVAAGNVVLLKPSELTPKTAAVIQQIVQNVFDANWVQVVQGGVAEATEILKQKFDFIFFTGSPQVGKIVHQAAAQFLTPTVLELGGKSPCVITESANINVAVNRIVFGKFVNAGQTCVAPDFIWIHESKKDEFLHALTARIRSCYGENIQQSTDFPRIINNKNYQRLVNFLNCGTIYFGGQHDESDLYVEPTVLTDVSWNDEVMQQEIFGPILPVITYKNMDEVIQYNQNNEKPLAFYIFSTNKAEINRVLSQVQFGGGCTNDVLSHLVNNKLPLSGFGNSGMGNYHGKFGFNTFTHQRAYVSRANWLDISLKYAPYRKKIKKLIAAINLIKQ
ncbi:aldehyde dehydrogenase [Flavobacterium agricola]|uniref:Aldehyde dehydrogenase n=1 Tax=Flavobacterium agricola TaxID=2870839 RepID=A0ABY6LYD6_9FLAO|nr:aldehyde dehydrogenase [Flavobacterium agricola]UYW00435.1 aldehyde dehydrogenase [Flavobacterium agricola]